MKFRYLSRLLAAFLFALPLSSGAAIFLKLPGLTNGDVNVPGYDDGSWFVVDSFSFGIERTFTEGGKAGTSGFDMGIGVLKECTISKSMDTASARLAQYAISGSNAGTVEIHFVQVQVTGGGGQQEVVAYLKYKLDRCFVKSWSTSGDADDRPTEEVSFYYNKIAFRYRQFDGEKFTDGGQMGWDNVENIPWTNHGLDFSK